MAMAKYCKNLKISNLQIPSIDLKQTDHIKAYNTCLKTIRLGCKLWQEYIKINPIIPQESF